MGGGKRGNPVAVKEISDGVRPAARLPEIMKNQGVEGDEVSGKEAIH